MSSDSAPPTFDIPAECIAGVVRDEGPDFYVEVTKVPVPEIGELTSKLSVSASAKT